MLIQIHAIQNHCPANLNRDDLGAPKSCYFGGVIRTRISSQCIKRSIRMGDEFKLLLGGVRTRRLAQLIAGAGAGPEELKLAKEVLKLCGIAPKEKRKKGGDEEDNSGEDKSAGLVYVSKPAISEMSKILKEKKIDKDMAKEFARLITEQTDVPDMALFGRMLEPKKTENVKTKGTDNGSKDGSVWKEGSLTVEASLQVAHAISTHEARPEIDYYVAADDVPGDDAGAAYVDEAMFASACFYKYFSIHWEALVKNLKGNEKLAAHTVGAFIRSVAMVNPTGKQNSFAAHNPPDGMLIEFKNTPISYANAFAKPVATNDRDIVSQSVAQLGQYVYDLDTGYGKPEKRFWFSPNLRYPLNVVEDNKEITLAGENIKSMEELVHSVINGLGHDWKEVREVVANTEVAG